MSSKQFSFNLPSCKSCFNTYIYTFQLYFHLYLYSAYAANYVYCTYIHYPFQTMYMMHRCQIETEIRSRFNANDSVIQFNCFLFQTSCLKICKEKWRQKIVYFFQFSPIRYLRCLSIGFSIMHKYAGRFHSFQFFIHFSSFLWWKCKEFHQRIFRSFSRLRWRHKISQIIKNFPPNYQSDYMLVKNPLGEATLMFILELKILEQNIYMST